MADRGDGAVFVVAGSRPWNRCVFDEVISTYPGSWTFVSTPDELEERLRTGIRPRYIFFLHWSAWVPSHVIAEHECVCFHMTDVPYGRGGSPLQNLIARGHHRTRLTALRMVESFDAGPVYTKRDLDLHGTAESIYIRAGQISSEIIRWMIEAEPMPIEQEGEPTVFRRRKPADSELCAGHELRTLDEMFDFIRMLDASGYPRAYIERSGFRFEFSRAARYDGRLQADVEITLVESATPSGSAS